jgi:peptidylprolyl isomerase
VGDRIERVTIIGNGQAAQAFRADQAAFDSLLRNVNAARAAESQARRNSNIAEILRKYPTATVTPLGLRYIIQRQGSDVKPTEGKMVRINYRGMLLSGRVFDNTELHGSPLEFQAGASQVIPGMDQAVLDMAVGEKRLVIIPPELAYGNAEIGNGLIPANSFLVFEIELLSVR